MDDIAGLLLLDDEGELSARLALRPGVRFVGCTSEAECIAAADKGNIGALDAGDVQIGVCAIGNGVYFCNTTGGDDWIASSVDVVRAWMRGVLPPGVLTVAPS